MKNIAEEGSGRGLGVVAALELKKWCNSDNYAKYYLNLGLRRVVFQYTFKYMNVWWCKALGHHVTVF